MPIDMTVLGRRTDPQKTILLFGSGSSIPSGALSTPALTAQLADIFGVEGGRSLTLPDLSTVIEAKVGRRPLVESISSLLSTIQPTGGLLNLPDFDWPGIYTTNYDNLIEQSYKKRKKSISVISSNFDFGKHNNPESATLYKLHGTVNQDESLGHQQRMVVSVSDYDSADEYREVLYAKFTEQLYSSDAIIIGQSLADPDLRSIVDRAVRIKRNKGAPGKITILSYEGDENQALVHEARGLDVCFGGIDEFFSEMSKQIHPVVLLPGISDDPLDIARDVRPSTRVVSVDTATLVGDLSRMFNGGAASYADIRRGWTFERDFAERIETQLSDASKPRIAYVLGSAGSGKTTGVRKALVRLVDRGIGCWEHVTDLPLRAASWGLIDDELRKRTETGVLLIDDAHENLQEVNALLDAICRSDVPALKVILVSSKPNWNPRLKSPAIFSNGQLYDLTTLSSRELNSLLDILDSKPDISSLVERNFLGFNRLERKRRLSERCRSDMFVCMRNIFASEAFDEIILREYAELIPDYQEVYKRIAGMEAAGVRVHRQLVLRSTGIEAMQVSGYLQDLEGIIEEWTINEREGIYGWRIRHSVIAGIISRRKISGENEYFSFLESTIDKLNPSYDIEAASINDICSPDNGLFRIHDKRKRNILLRKMISLAPRLRVPRHRLITNLISLGEYDNAGSEIRLFENELYLDGPVQRYKVQLLLERATNVPGLMDEDRAAMIREAAGLAEAGISRFPDDKNLYRIFLESGVAYLKYRPDREIFDNAMSMAQAAYDRILDPDLGRVISVFEQTELRFTA